MFTERAQNNVSGFRLEFSLGRQNNATQRTTSRRHTDGFKIKLYYVSRTVQVRLHTVQTHLSAPPNLLIQKTFILFPLRRKRKWRGGRAEGRGGRRGRSRTDMRGRLECEEES